MKNITSRWSGRETSSGCTNRFLRRQTTIPPKVPSVPPRISLDESVIVGDGIVEEDLPRGHHVRCVGDHTGMNKVSDVGLESPDAGDDGERVTLTGLHDFTHRDGCRKTVCPEKVSGGCCVWTSGADGAGQLQYGTGTGPWVCWRRGAGARRRLRDWTTMALACACSFVIL